MSRVGSHIEITSHHGPDLHLDLQCHMGVVTVIYFNSGGLSFAGDDNAVSVAGLDDQVTNDVLAEALDCC